MDRPQQLVDRNVDTISNLLDNEQPAVYGDASLPDILKNAHLETAKLLVITVPDVGITDNIIHMALDMNPKIQIVARASYLADVNKLQPSWCHHRLRGGRGTQYV